MLFITLCGLVMLAVMNAILFNGAFPTIAEQFSIEASTVSWLAVGYSLTVAMGSMIYGKLAERFSLQRLFQVAILLLSGGSLLGFVSSSFPFVLAARVIQASGGSAMIVLTMITIAQVMPEKKRVLALSIVSSIIALAVGLGPLIASMTAEWHQLFLVMMLSLFALPFIRIRQTMAANTLRFDWFSLGALFIAVVSLLLMVNQSLLWGLGFVGGGSIFIFSLRKRQYPLFAPQLFRNVAYLRASLVSMMMNVVLLGVFYLLPQFESDVGAILFSAALSGMIASLVVSKWRSDRLLVVATLCLLMAVIGLFSSAYFVIVAFMAYSSLQVALNRKVVDVLPRELTAAGTGFYHLLNFVGMALGPALCSRLLEYGYWPLVVVAVGQVLVVWSVNKGAK